MPLLRKSDSRSLAVRTRHWMNVDVKREHADIILVLCYMVTGLLDSASISIWGSFVSMQTGTSICLPSVHIRCTPAP